MLGMPGVIVLVALIATLAVAAADDEASSGLVLDGNVCAADWKGCFDSKCCASPSYDDSHGPL